MSEAENMENINGDGDKGSNSISANKSNVNATLSAGGNLTQIISDGNITIVQSQDVYDSDKRQLIYDDPTQKYENISDDHSYYEHLNNTKLCDFRKSLLSYRVGIISSYDEFAMRAVIFYLLDSFEFISFEQRQLIFAGSNCERNDIHFDALIGKYFKKESRKIVIVSTDSSSQSESFLKILKHVDFRAFHKGFTDSLSNNGFVLISVSSMEQIKYFKGFNLLPVLDVPYLEGLKGFVKKEYCNADFGRIYEQLLRIVNLNLFGKNEEDIYISIRDKIDKNKEGFWAEISERNDEINAEGVEIVLKRIALENDPGNYFSQDEPLNLYLIYLGTFFSKLSVSEFDYITELFLNDPGKIYYTSSKDGDKKLLLERWKMDPDHFLRKVKLKAYYSDETEYEIISFEDELIRPKFKEYLYANFSNFCHTQFIFLYSKGLVLDPEIPQRILDNLISLACELAQRDPGRYAKKLLLDTTINLASMVEKKEETEVVDIINGNSDIKKILTEYDKKQVEIAIIKNYAFERVSRLVTAMLMKEKLVPAIENYLDTLLDMRLDEACVYLLKHSISGFDVKTRCKRIRQVLHRAGNESKSKPEAAQLLINTVVNSSSLWLDSFFALIQSWVKDDPEIKSYSGAVGLSFILGYLDKVINMLPYADYGKWPSKLHCFGYIETTEQFESRISIVFQWLFHDKLSSESDREQSDDESTDGKGMEPTKHLVIRFVEELYFVLNGFDEFLPAESGGMKSEILEIFWKQFFLLIPQRYTNIFSIRIEQAADFYFERYEIIPKANKEEKSYYRVKYKIAGEFKKRILKNKNKHLFI